MKQKATQLIKDNAPWLKELSFGCEVGKAGTFYIGCSDDYSEHWFYRPDQIQGGQDDIFYSEDVDVDHLESTIIGHPITIGDVLRVIQGFENYHASMQSHGELVIFNNDHDDEPQQIPYNLTQPFDNQSDEFYAFIVELLGNE